MLVTYFRSSSINTHTFCEQQYFLSYVLGIPQNTNKKAELGTIFHKVMECLAASKLAAQNGETTFTDSSLGTFPLDVDIARLLDLSFDYYSGKSDNSFDEEDRAKCLEWCYRALKFNDGKFDPRNQWIISPEQRFDLTIDRPWAKINCGGVESQLAIRGTMDLVIEESPNVLVCVDYKTGARKDWATGEIKTHKKLRDDLQLRMYHYALSRLFPQYRTIIIAIYFVNETRVSAKEIYPPGIFPVVFTREDLPIFEAKLKAKFDRVKECELPELSKSWKCSRLCTYGKNNYPGTDRTICDHIHSETKEHGLLYTIENFTTPGHNVGIYHAPGE